MKRNKILFAGKNAFTLLEVVISITIFMIILLFLYKALDDTKITNNKFESHVYKKEEKNNLYKIFAEDIAEVDGDVEILSDEDKNSFVRFKSNNSFNNAFYLNITYMISSSNHLIRIESLDKFQKENSGLEFYENSFIDTLLEDVEKFIVLLANDTEKDKIVFIVKQKEKEKMIFSTFIMER